MAHSFRIHFFHLIWSTKQRQQLIQKEIRDGLYKYLGGIVKNQKGHLLQAGGMPDHMHLLIELSLLDKYTYLIRDLKSYSTSWVRKTYPTYKHFSWQEGFASYSVSYSAVDSVKKYIINQEEHHKTMTFEEEYKKLLDLHCIKIDERYIFG